MSDPVEDDAESGRQDGPELVANHDEEVAKAEVTEAEVAKAEVAEAKGAKAEVAEAKAKAVDVVGPVLLVPNGVLITIEAGTHKDTKAQFDKAPSASVMDMLTGRAKLCRSSNSLFWEPNINVRNAVLVPPMVGFALIAGLLAGLLGGDGGMDVLLLFLGFAFGGAIGLLFATNRYGCLPVNPNKPFVLAPARQR